MLFVPIELSIVIPTYNSEKYLSECLKSICQQIKKNVEVIIVNDCSTDKTKKIIKQYANQLNYVKLINLKKNRGVSYCRNVGIKCAFGKYILFLDSDDILLKGAINSILNNIKTLPEKELFILKSFFLKHNKILKNKLNKDQFFELTRNKSIINYYNKNFVKFRGTCWNYIVKKKFLLSNNIYFKNINISEDWVYVSEILCFANDIKIIQTPFYVHRMAEINTLGKKSGYVMSISRIKVIYELTKFIYRNKKLLNIQKIRFLLKIIKLASEHALTNITICKSNEIKKVSKFFYKNKLVFLKISNLGFKEFDFFLQKNKNINEVLLKYKYLKAKVIKKINEKFRSNKIILYCAGNYGEVVLKNFINIGAKINILIDNNPLYFEKKMGKATIKNLPFLKRNLRKFINHKILICNKKIIEFKKIKLQLTKIGIKSKNIIHFIKI